MKRAGQAATEKIADYLHGRVTQAELADWAERAMMDAGFEPADPELLADIIIRLGLADVGELGIAGKTAKTFFVGLAIAPR